MSTAIEQRTTPIAPEQRTVDVNVESVETRGRTLYGYAAVYGAESGDLGGFRERIAPGAFRDVLGGDVRCLLNHDANVVLGRTRSGTLRLFDEDRGLRFEVDLPESRPDIREAVERGDIDGASFRFRVGRDSWQGEVRTVEQIAELHDVTVATYGAYPEASVELRTRPESNGGSSQTPPVLVSRQRNGGLAVEDRAAADEPTVESRITDAIRSVRKGESRSLTTTNAEPIAPPELSTFLWDRLRPASIALASGVRVIPTDRESIVWPRLTSDVDPTWVAETEVIPAGDPGFGELTATPKKLAHRVELSNEVIDDSEPSVIEVLNGHLTTMLGLKLDRGVFEGNPAADADSIRGLKYVAGIQTVDMGTNGAVLGDYDPFIEAVAKLRAANVPPPYVVAANPSVVRDLELLKEEPTSNLQLGRPEGLPPFYTSSQLSTNEAKGTATDTSSAYVYSPAEIVLVRRKDAEVELDRSRLFDRDMSEVRAKLRADLLVPNGSAVCRIVGIVPAA